MRQLDLLLQARLWTDADDTVVIYGIRDAQNESFVLVFHVYISFYFDPSNIPFCIPAMEKKRRVPFMRCSDLRREWEKF